MRTASPSSRRLGSDPAALATPLHTFFQHPARKLLRLRVDFGDRFRVILSGMKGEREHPDELVGRQALFVVNLAARRMAGEVSEGMLLDIGYADGIVPVLVVPERPVPDGSRLG